MKRLLILLLVISYCHQGIALTDEEVALMNAPGRVIPLAVCDEIQIDTASGWWLRIWRNGSARFGYGSSPIDLVELPVGSLSFSDVHRKLSAIKFDGVGVSRDPCVGFHEQDAKIIHCMSTTEHELVKELYQVARAHVEDFEAVGRLARLWSERPPEP